MLQSSNPTVQQSCSPRRMHSADGSRGSGTCGKYCGNTVADGQRPLDRGTVGTAYSSASAAIGEIRAARCAGSRHAISETVVMTARVPASVAM